jgi:hypothetical protein
MKKMIFYILFVLSGNNEIDKLAKYMQTLEFEKIQIFNNATEFYSEIELVLKEDKLITDIKMQNEFIVSIFILFVIFTLLHLFNKTDKVRMEPDFNSIEILSIHYPFETR